VKRSGRDEPTFIAKHMCMGAKLGISLYSYLYPKVAKPLLLSYYLLCFLFNKIGGQEGTWKTADVQNAVIMALPRWGQDTQRALFTGRLSRSTTMCILTFSAPLVAAFSL
jgi:hypothetical protein